MKLLWKLYVWTWRRILEPVAFKFVVSELRFKEGAEFVANFRAAHPAAPAKKRLWFHAASVGELESLWPVAELYAQEAAQTYDFILTAFSESAQKSLENLKAVLEFKGAKVLSTGLSPWEGRWREAVAVVKPAAFITAKYEAWPELWVALAAEGVPNIVVGARLRKSLVIGKNLVRWFGGTLPKQMFLAVLFEDVEPLKQGFPAAEVPLVGEPRWDRVASRSKRGSDRARKLVEHFIEAPRPWGILGSAWASDLQVIINSLAVPDGTIWAVPHKVDEVTIHGLERSFTKAGFNVYKASQLSEGVRATSSQRQQKDAATCILVDEMGFLSELYASADWAYVGGGFEKGVHSTIEPALYAIPICCGPMRAERFSEIIELRQTEQLTVISDAVEFEAWMQGLVKITDDVKHKWSRQIQTRLGASQRAKEQIDKMLA